MSGRPKGWALPHTSTAPSPSQSPTQQRTTRGAYISPAPCGILFRRGPSDIRKTFLIQTLMVIPCRGQVAAWQLRAPLKGAQVRRSWRFGSMTHRLGRRGPLAGPVGVRMSPAAFNEKSQDKPKEKSRAAAGHSAPESAAMSSPFTPNATTPSLSARDDVAYTDRLVRRAGCPEWTSHNDDTVTPRPHRPRDRDACCIRFASRRATESPSATRPRRGCNEGGRDEQVTIDDSGEL